MLIDHKLIKLLYNVLFVIYIFLYSAAFASPIGTEPKVRVQVIPNRVLIGDKVRYCVSVKIPSKAKIELIKSEKMQFPKGFAVSDFGQKLRKYFWGKYFHAWYILETYSTGSFKLPSFKFKYTSRTSDQSEITTEEASLDVVGILQQRKARVNIEKLDIKPIKGPIKVGVHFIWWVLAFLIGTVLVFTTAEVLRRFVMVKKQIPLDKTALDTIDSIKKKFDEGIIDIKTYCSAISECVRDYIEKRFCINAPEMTTEEFLMSVRESEELPKEHRLSLQNFLFQCDLVKFAKVSLPAQKLYKLCEIARDFIVKTRPDVGQEKK